jgi:hypothetical protein
MPSLGFFETAGISDTPYLDQYGSHPKGQEQFSSQVASRCAHCIRLTLSCDLMPTEQQANACAWQKNAIFTTTTPEQSCTLKETVHNFDISMVPSQCARACGNISELQFGEGYTRPFRDQNTPGQNFVLVNSDILA